MNQKEIHIQRALLSTYDKTGLIPFAKRLSEMGIQLISTGGTHQELTKSGLQVQELSEYTGFPEIMGGRVKTLHPKIHGGILARRGVDEAILSQLGIEPIGLVVCNLYPFERVVEVKGTSLETAIENIDIGGPALLRAAAKNHEAVGVVIDPNDYEQVAEELTRSKGYLSSQTKLRLAVKAFWHVAHYDTVIADYLGKHLPKGEQFPETLTCTYRKLQDLRYGENPHQRAAFYKRSPTRLTSFAHTEQIQGKELSFNNLLDANHAWKCVVEFEEPTCVIVKHGNPCGVASAPSLKLAYQNAYDADPTSAFGGVIAANRTLDALTCETILKNQFVELILIPEIEEQAQKIAKEKPNVRLVVWQKRESDQRLRWELREIFGGDVLVQTEDVVSLSKQEMIVATKKAPTEEELRNLLFAWKVAKHVKSNAIVCVKNNQTIGIGAGQMNRVDSVKLAILKASENGFRTEGAVLASDAFFPFADGVELAGTAGIKAIIQPGGSIRDKEVIAAADRYGIAMVFTGIRHFRH